MGWGGHGWRMVLEWFKNIMFIVHFISIIITSTPPASHVSVGTSLNSGSPALDHRLVHVHGLLGTAQQEGSSWRAREASSVFTATPIAQITTLSQYNNVRNKVHDKCSALESS